MARRCGVSGKGVLSGNNVSHANNKTRCRFLPNIQNVSFLSEILNRQVHLRISVNGVRTIEQNGGLDAFLISAPDNKLSTKVLALKKLILRKKAKKIEENAGKIA
jgi:large subunit ribosomal protein L28